MASLGNNFDALQNGQLIVETIEAGDVAKPKPSKGNLVELLIKSLVLHGDNHTAMVGSPLRRFWRFLNKAFLRRQDRHMQHGARSGSCHRSWSYLKVDLPLRSFRLGEGDECSAFEAIAPLMRPGEICAIRSIPAAFELELELIKARPDATVEAVVQLVRVETPPCAGEWLLAEQLEEARKKKRRGHWLFERKEFQAALLSFSLGLSYLSETCHEHVASGGSGDINHEDRDQFLQEDALIHGGSGDCNSDDKDKFVREESLRVCCVLYTDLALVQFELPDQAGKVLASCNAALEIQPENLQAMYLKAKALLAAECLDDPQLSLQEAIETLQRALEIKPDNEPFQTLLDTALYRQMDGNNDTFMLVRPVILFAASYYLAYLLGSWYYKNQPIPGSDGGHMRGDDVI